jgi:hypothetical protein
LLLPNFRTTSLSPIPAGFGHKTNQQPDLSLARRKGPFPCHRVLEFFFWPLFEYLHIYVIESIKKGRIEKNKGKEEKLKE